MKCTLTLLGALVFLAGCNPSPMGERAVTQGTNPALPQGAETSREPAFLTSTCWRVSSVSPTSDVEMDG